MSHSMRWGMLLDELLQEIIEPTNKKITLACLKCQGDSYSYYINKYILTYRLINSIRALLTPGEDASK